MKLIWNGHACFTVQTADCVIVLDPYADHYVPGYPPLSLQADRVYCSHDHSDHSAAHVVSLSGHSSAIPVSVLESWHDDVQGAKRGGNRIHILTCEGMKVVHLGDLGCELTPAQTAALQNTDILMIPVGGFYTIGPAQAADIVKQISPRVVVPMHYRGENFGYDVLAGVEDFLTLLSLPVTRLNQNQMEITPETPPQIMVPFYHTN